MIVECYRDAGERTGQPIVEPLLSDAALIHRGRAEMDANAHELNQITLSVVPRPGVRLGQLVEASDPSSAIPYRGKIVGMQISVRIGEQDVDFEQTVNIEVPLVY